MGIHKSALKIHAPANRAFVKRTMADEIAEIVEFCVAESAPWHKEFPLFKRDYSMSSMTLLTRSIVTSPFALMRSPVLLPFYLLVVKGSSAMLMILMNGKVRQFKRMKIL